MGKRSNFERAEKDFYPTPYEAVVPLLPHLEPGTEFVEPCVGAGDLVCYLEWEGHTCVRSFDVEVDATKFMFRVDDLVITNPPWSRKILHPIIDNILSCGAEAWLLFDADWMHTKQSSGFIKFCTKIISVGRVKWIPNTKMTGKDNCCWYQFCPRLSGQTQFIGR